MPTEFPPESQYTLTIDGTTYNYLPEKLLHERETIPPFKRFLAKHCDIQEKQFNNIAWDLTARAIDTVNLSKMIPIIKYTSNKWATGDKMHLYFKEEEACPFCGQKENMKHVFSCNNETALTHRDEALTSLKTRLNKINKTKGQEWHSLASQAIKELGGDTKLDTPEMNTSHHHQHQTEIGWLNFLQGRVAKKIWTELQKGRGAGTGATSIKAIWKIASIIWRRRNRKKHGKTPKERTHKRKERYDKKIEALRDTMMERKIPHRPAPIGQRFRVDSKKQWMRWHTTTLQDWNQEYPFYNNNNTSPKTSLETSIAKQSHSSSTANLGNATHNPQIRLPSTDTGGAVK
jgi:hypothetical protein